MDVNANISATPFEGLQNNFFGNNTPYGADSNSRYDMDPNFAASGDWTNADMWYLPPGPAFFQNSDQAITQTAEGVNVGGFDLLEYMAMDTFADMNGSNGIGTGF